MLKEVLCKISSWWDQFWCAYMPQHRSSVSFGVLFLPGPPRSGVTRTLIPVLLTGPGYDALLVQCTSVGVARGAMPPKLLFQDAVSQTKYCYSLRF